MSRLLTYLFSFALLGATLMWFTSYTHYTSIGIDADTKQNGLIAHHYYRARWPGNGSIWFGGGISQRASDPAHPYEPFDLAATFLYPDPQKPKAHSLWNRLGFWREYHSSPDIQYWLGIPAFIPIMLFSGLLFWIKKTPGDA